MEQVKDTKFRGIICPPTRSCSQTASNNKWTSEFYLMECTNTKIMTAIPFGKWRNTNCFNTLQLNLKIIYKQTLQ
jgi:hypothetical protein